MKIITVGTYLVLPIPKPIQAASLRERRARCRPFLVKHTTTVLDSQQIVQVHVMIDKLQNLSDSVETWRPLSICTWLSSWISTKRHNLLYASKYIANARHNILYAVIIVNLNIIKWNSQGSDCSSITSYQSIFAEIYNKWYKTQEYLAWITIYGKLWKKCRFKLPGSSSVGPVTASVSLISRRSRNRSANTVSTKI